MTQTSLFKKWLLTLLFLSSFMWLHAQSAYEYIEEHRQWMKEHYPKAENLNESQLLREAAFAIMDELREPEAMMLLHAVGKQIPEVEAYAIFEETDGKDYKFVHTLQALKALYHYAEQQLGRENVTTGWCKYLWMNCRSNIENIYPLMDDLIREQKVAAQKNNNKENKALVCLFQLLKFDVSQLETFINSPDLYDEVLQTEQEAVKLYPFADKTPSHMRAWLYTRLGAAKSSFSALLESEVAFNKVELLSDSYYSHNSNTGILHNAEHYFRLAEETYLKLFKPGHPEVIEYYVSAESARENYNTISDDNIDVLKVFYDYSSQYYGQGTLPTILRKLNYWSMLASRGKDIKDVFMWRSILDSFKQYLGEECPYYSIMALHICEIVAIYAPNDFNEASQIFDEAVTKAWGENNMKSAYMRYMLYSSLKDIMPQVYKEKVEPIAEYYAKNHSKDFVSILLGRRMALDVYMGTRDLQTGTNIQKHVCEDTEQRYGASSYVYLQEKAMELNWLGSFDSEAARKQYPTVIEQMKKANIDHTDVLGDYANLENGAYNLELAAKLYQQAYDESKDEGLTQRRAYLLLSKLSVLNVIKGTEKEQESVYAKARKILDTNTDSLDFIPINYGLASDWLYSKGRIKEALSMVNKGIDICHWQDSGFSNTYINLLIKRYNIYMYGLDDMSTAYKLMNEDLEMFEQQNLNYYTTDMLDFLWGIYDLMPKNNDNINTLMKYFALIAKMTTSIGQQNGQEPRFMSVYGVRLYCELIRFYIQGTNIKKQVNTDQMSEDQRMAWARTWKNFDDNFDMLASIEAQLNKLQDQLPQFNKQIWYFNMLDAFENYYLYLKPDKEKAFNYMIMHKEQCKDVFTIEYNNICIKLFDFYLQNKQYTEAKNLYTQDIKPFEEDAHATAYSKLPLYNLMCNLCLAQHDYKEMLPYARKHYEAVKDIMSRNFPMLTEQEQNAFMESYGDPSAWLSTCLAGMKDKQQIASEVYNAVLYRTGIQLRSQRETREAIMKSNDKNLISLVDSLNTLRSEQKAIKYDFLNDAQDEINKKYALNTSYQQRINLLEREIVEQSAPYRNKTPLDATWQQVCKQLKNGEAAVEFTFAYPYWMALVLTPTCKEPKAVPLVIADTLFTKLKALGVKTPTAIARKLYNDKAIDLYTMLWQPLETELNGIKKVYYGTQGLLSAIAFAAIACPDGSYLTDHYDLCPLTTTAQLLTKTEEHHPKSILVMGDIYYSDKQREQVNQGNINDARGDEDTAIDDFSERASKRYHFKYLPFTQSEVLQIEKTFTGHPLTVKVRTEATEETLRSQLTKKPDVVHLATHGFFISNEITALKVPFFKHHNLAAGNSMMRAGVALADAEDTWDGTKTPQEANDGILTADEVSKFNLHGTQLVALSACETALGDYTFEGVMGLPRGFKQAGVQSLLVSLWSVNDKSTAQLMTAFYRYWIQGKTKQQAFKQAVAEVRKDYPQPYYWAPFMLLDAIK